MKKPYPIGTSDRLVHAATLYRREARKCIKGKAYLAATVMEVAALEAALQSMCSIYFNDVKRTTVYRKKTFRRKRDKVLELTLNQLIDIAAELGWFPSKKIIWAGKRADVAGFAHKVREFRNLLHPGRLARERTPTKFSKGTHEIVCEVCDVATSWLLHRIDRSLLRAMQREKTKRKRR